MMDYNRVSSLLPFQRNNKDRIQISIFFSGIVDTLQRSPSPSMIWTRDNTVCKYANGSTHKVIKSYTVLKPDLVLGCEIMCFSYLDLAFLIVFILHEFLLLFWFKCLLLNVVQYLAHCILRREKNSCGLVRNETVSPPPRRHREAVAKRLSPTEAPRCFRSLMQVLFPSVII